MFFSVMSMFVLWARFTDGDFFSNQEAAKYKTVAMIFSAKNECVGKEIVSISFLIWLAFPGYYTGNLMMPGKSGCFYVLYPIIFQ